MERELHFQNLGKFVRETQPEILKFAEILLVERKYNSQHFIKIGLWNANKITTFTKPISVNANKIPGITKETPLRKIDNSVVIGCGTMGGGIAMSLANAGIPVSVIENDEEFLKKGMNIIRSNYSATVSKGRLSQEEMDTRMSLITPTTNWDCIKDTDLVIEAVFEEMPIKKEDFKKIDKLAKEVAILA